MKQPVFLAVALLWTALASSADQSQNQVTGVVRSSKSGEPLKSAVVLLRAASGEQKTFRTTTVADGSFGFAGLPPGQYQLTIRKPGYQVFQSNVPIVILRDGAEVVRLAPAL